jgi:dsRNA-specific ribonuclease
MNTFVRSEKFLFKNYQKSSTDNDSSNKVREEKKKGIIEFTNRMFGLTGDQRITLLEHVNLFVKSVTTQNYYNYNKFAVVSEPDGLCHDYQTLELLGDKALQYTFTRYLYTSEKMKHVEILKRKGGENISTRLVIKYLSRKYLSRICAKIGLEKMIMSWRENLSVEELQEDVFEAWIGACSIVFTAEKLQEFLFGIYDDMNLDLSYESLVDVKTRLNDLAASLYKRLIKHDIMIIEDGIGCVSYSIGDLTATGTGHVRTCPGGNVCYREIENIAAENLFIEFIRVNGKAKLDELLSKSSHYKTIQLFKTGVEEAPKKPDPVVLKRKYKKSN